MLIYWNKRKHLHEKRVQLPEDLLGTPTWPPFHCFGTPIWLPWRHVKTLYDSPSLTRTSRWLEVFLNFCFPPDHFYIILHSITENHVQSPWQVGKKCTEVGNIESTSKQPCILSITFTKCCCPQSEVCMILAFLPHPVFLFLVICFVPPITRTFFDFPRRLGSRLYRDPRNGESRNRIPGKMWKWRGR